MTKDVMIKICGLQMGPDSDGEPIEMVISGEYYYKNNKHYILYDELMDGDSVTVKNRIKYGQGCMELTKSGLVSVHMVFEEGKQNMTQYNTPYGSLLMGVEAKKIQFAETEDILKLNVDYALAINEEHSADCNIRITVRPKEF